MGDRRPAPYACAIFKYCLLPDRQAYYYSKSQFKRGEPVQTDHLFRFLCNFVCLGYSVCESAAKRQNKIRICHILHRFYRDPDYNIYCQAGLYLRIQTIYD